MTEYRFHGTERHTLELDGTFDPAALALPAGLAYDLAGGRARVSLFAFAVDRIKITGVPLLAWSYAELLWRIAVLRDAEPAWWVIACDLGPRGPAFAARRYVRYDVRRLPVALTEDRLTVPGLSIGIGPADAPGAAEQRALLVGRDAAWQVPWGDDAAQGSWRPVTVEQDSLSVATVGGPVTWSNRGLYRGGRQHRCGVARRWDRATRGT